MTSGRRPRPISRRAFLRGSAGALGAAALASCRGGRHGARPAGTAQQGGALERPTIRTQGGDFGYPSPFTYLAAPGYWRMSYLFDTLLWPDSTGEFLPWLASRHERSDDGTIHRFELREAVWHDGRPLTARDVIFTFEYFASHAPTLTPLIIAVPRNVATVTAAGERGVEFHLDQPDVTFTRSVLGSVPIIPEHIWSKIDNPQAVDSPEATIGTGPYRLSSYSEAEGRLAFDANEDFFLGEPFVGRIEQIYVEDELVAVRAGELDAGQAPVEGVRDDVLDPFRADPAYGVVSHESSFAFPLYWNMARGGALADERFRRACLMAIDREDIVRRLLSGNGTVGSAGFLPPGHPYHVDVESYAYDPDAAAALLDEAGYRRGPDGMRHGPGGAPLRLTLHTHDTVPPALPELVAASLEDAGIGIDRETVDLVRLFGAKTQGNYDLLINLYPGPVGTTPNGDPDILRPIYHSEPPNQLYAASGYANPELDRLLERQRVTFDPAERKQIVGEIQRIVARDLPVAVLYYTTMFSVYRAEVFDGWYYTEGGFGPGIPDVYNKHAFVTGRPTGLDIRGAAEA